MKKAAVLQTVSSANLAQYQIIENGSVCYTAETRYIAGDTDIRVFPAGSAQPLYRIHREEKLLPQGPAGRRHCWEILRYDAPAGCVFQSAAALSGRYGMEYQGRVFDVTMIGAGKEGMKLPVFVDGAQVALLEKGAKVRNNLDAYMLYVLDDSLLEPLMLFALYLDRIRYSNSLEVVSHSVETEYTYTLSREKRALYSPDWVRRFDSLPDPVFPNGAPAMPGAPVPDAFKGAPGPYAYPSQNGASPVKVRKKWVLPVIIAGAVLIVLLAIGLLAFGLFATLNGVSNAESYTLGPDSVPSVSYVVGKRWCNSMSVNYRNGSVNHQYQLISQSASDDARAYAQYLVEHESFGLLADGDAGAPAGTVRLGKNSQEAGKILLMEIRWSPGEITLYIEKSGRAVADGGS